MSDGMSINIFRGLRLTKQDWSGKLVEGVKKKGMPGKMD